jgi:hypothetical protein
MTKPILLISYANSVTQPLPNLKREEESVLKILQGRKSLRDDFDIETPSSREGMVDVLKDTIKRESLLVFSYSGHAAGDRLITEGEETNSEGIVALLSRCPNLALVILNGCSTEGQVAQLFESFSETGYKAPIIVATNASVGDKVATDFGIAFSEQIFTYGRNFKTAFEMALSVAKTHTEAHSLREDERESRFLNKIAKEGTWGIYVADGKNKNDVTEITFNQVNTFTDTSYIPNDRLFKGLITELVNYNSDIEKQFEEDDRAITDIDIYKSKIYECFQLPISKRLQRLESSGSAVDGKDVIFFNKMDKNRLGELLRTYQTIIDILFAIIKAEYYSYIDKFESSCDKDQMLKVVTIYSNASDVFYGKIAIVQAFELCLKNIYLIEENLMVKELALFKELDKNEFIKLGYHFENLQKNYPTLSNSEANELVEFTEIRLSELFNHILFLSKYNLTSVENILLNRRRTKNPQYRHQLYKHQGSGIKPSKKNEVLNEFLDDSSVILHRKVDKNPFGQYLNLNPFLIDDMLSEEKATISNIMALSKYKEEKEKGQSEETIVRFEYRYLIYGSLEQGKKIVMFQKNTNYNNKIDFENRAFAEIKGEWDTYQSKIAKIQEEI